MATAAPFGFAHSHDKGRNRDERRAVFVLNTADKLADTDWHPHVATITRVEHDVYTRNTKTGLLRHSSETAFYIANTPVTATCAAEAIGAHWTLENTSYHSREVTLGGVAQGSGRGSGWNGNGGEDRSRIRANPGVFARLRSFAFNILEANQTDTLSRNRYRAGLVDIKKLLRMLAVSKR